MFSENQSRQFYVLNTTADYIKYPAIAPVDTVTASNNLTDSSPDGAAKLICKGDGEGFIFYKGPNGGLQRTDTFKKCNITQVSCVDAADSAHKCSAAAVTLADTAVVGQVYVLNVNVHGYMSLDYNSTYNKFGVYKPTSTTASDFYKGLALSLAKNIGREPIELFEVYLTTDLTKNIANTSYFTKVTAGTAASGLAGTYTGIVIQEAKQPWRLGAAPEEFVNFTVEPGTIYDAVTQTESVWGKVQVYGQSKYTDGTTSATSLGSVDTFPNSRKLADMEWFYHKERGDIYGELGWPNNIDTKLMINPDFSDGYSTLDIHYFYEGNSHNIGHSEKTITVVGTKAAIKQLIGVAASGDDPATGLYAFLDGTGVTIQTSASW